MDQVNLTAWEGRTTAQSGVISATQAAQIHATLGQPSRLAPTDGQEMPLLWHWCAFTPTVAMEALAQDGHPKLGGFLPPVPLGRRMWASGTLRFRSSLRVGQPFTMQSSIAKVVEKEGKTGRMVFVSVDHMIETDGTTAIEERQDIVYLDIPDRFRPPAKQPMPEATHQMKVSEALLFRYSAITFNAHRIHYDLPYAQQVEHYPGLVVHGPLQATWLIDAARAKVGKPPTQFAFRGVHPMVLVPGDNPKIDISVRAGEDDGALHLSTGQNGHQCMQATAKWEDKT